MTGTLESSNLGRGAEIIMKRGGGWKALFRGNAVNVMRWMGGRSMSLTSDTLIRILPASQECAKQGSGFFCF